MSTFNNGTLLDITLGLPADATILSLSVVLFLVELGLITTVIIGHKAYSMFCGYKLKNGAKQEGLWLHLLFNYMFFFALFKIACQIAHLVQKAQRKVNEQDLFTIVVSMTLLDVTFAILLKILLRVAKQTFLDTKKTTIAYYAICVVLVLNILLSTAATIYTIVVFAVVPLNQQRVYALGGTVPLVAIVKAVFAVMLLVIGARIIYAITKSSQVSQESKRVAIKIVFAMISVVVAAIILLIGVGLAFVQNGYVVMTGLLVASIIPEGIMFLAISIVFWPKRFTYTRKQRQEEPKQLESITTSDTYATPTVLEATPSFRETSPGAPITPETFADIPDTPVETTV
jgi:hypothetical protein